MSSDELAGFRAEAGVDLDALARAPLSDAQRDGRACALCGDEGVGGRAFRAIGHVRGVMLFVCARAAICTEARVEAAHAADRSCGSHWCGRCTS